MSEQIPEVISGAEEWNPGQDPARYLINPGVWNPSLKRTTPGQLAHARPWLDSGRHIFVWPTPTEGFRRQGSNQLALHHYIGQENVDVQIIHRGEKRIELTGVFPGLSAQQAMVNLENCLNDDPPDIGMTLNVPGVFDQVKFVQVESWEFTHDTDDNTHSISYSVTFIVMGEGQRVPDPVGSTPPVNPLDSPGTPIIVDDPFSDGSVIDGGDASDNQPGGGGGSGNTGGGGYSYDINDWIYGATIPAGYTADQLHSWAAGFAPTYGGHLFVPMHIMNQGQVVDGKFSVKYTDPNTPPASGNDTLWIPLPPQSAPPSSTPAPPGSSGPPTGGGGGGGFTTTGSVRTLRAVSAAVYGTPDRWSDVLANNAGYLEAASVLGNVPTFLWPVYDLPVGIHLST